MKNKLSIDEFILALRKLTFLNVKIASVLHFNK